MRKMVSRFLVHGENENPFNFTKGFPSGINQVLQFLVVLDTLYFLRSYRIAALTNFSFSQNKLFVFPLGQNHGH